jgi:predicted PurR-regulated permease PerM
MGFSGTIGQGVCLLNMKKEKKVKGDDIRTGFEVHREKINESFGMVSLHPDPKERIITIVVAAVILATIWFMLDLVILTFIVTFVFYHLNKYAVRGLGKTPLRVIPKAIVQVLVYSGVIVLAALFIAQNAQMIVSQFDGLIASFSQIDFQNGLTGLDPALAQLLKQIDVNKGVMQVGGFIAGAIGKLGGQVINFLIAFILSFLFILEKHKIYIIAETMKRSRIVFLYRYFMLFFGSFCHTFGKVMKVQVLIAAFDCAIVTTYLVIAGFPNFIMLGVMVFLLSLIPMMGAVLTAVPLVLIALSIGGLAKVVEVVVVIIIINCLEAYVLNPKLMSRRTSLPVTMVFVILFVSQQYLGGWGMIVGIPFFMFVMNVLGIDYTQAAEPQASRGRQT